MGIPWHIIVRRSQKQSANIPPMIRRCTSLPTMEALHSRKGDDHPHWSQANAVIQTKGKLQNDRHQKWSTYLQQFHLNIINKKGITSRVADFLSRPLVTALTIVLNSCSHDTSRWSQLYANDLIFATTYQLVSACTLVANFHLQDGLLCHLGHLYVLSSEHAKLIWESHYYQVVGHFGVDKMVAMLQKYFYWTKLQQDVNKYIRSCTACTITKPMINKQGLYTPLPAPNKP